MSESEQGLDILFKKAYTRRELLLRSAAVAGAGVSLGSLLAACGKGTTSSAASPTTGGGLFTNATPKAGGTLVYSRRQGPTSLDPLNNVGGNGDIFATEIIFSSLVRPDPLGSDKLVAGLSDQWSVSPDGRDYTFHIRDNARFSNGDTVTADDVKFSMDRFGNPKLNTMLPNLAVGYKTTQVVDKSTVVIHLDHAVSSFLYNISIFPAFIVPKKLVEQQGKNFFNKPIGSGPYAVKSWVLNSQITFERNPYYWESGKPYLDTVRFDYATDDNTRMLALKTGQAQAVDGVPFTEIASMKSDSAVVLQVSRVPYFEGLSLNHKRPYFADVNVRQALQYAIDKEGINKTVFAGVGTIPNSVLPALLYDASPQQVPPYPYDMAKAKQLMAKSAFPNGFSTTLQYPAGFEYYRKLALILQASWQQIGANVKLLEQDQGTETQRFFRMDYDMTFPFAQYTSDLVVPDEYASFYLDPTSGLNGFYTNWYDASIWHMFQKFLVGDEATRASLWPQIQKAMMDASPTINIMDLPFVQAYATNVRNPYVNALGANRLEDTWLA
jgi:peptide/nickel transport system substrate-binding protein